MNCHNIPSLTGPYLDSELDAKTTQDVLDHLEACPRCAAMVAREAGEAERLKAALRTGPHTPALWQTIHQQVAAAGTAPKPVCTPKPADAPLTSGWLSWLWPNPRFYAGLAAAWVVILAVQLLTLDPAITPVVAQVAAPPSDIATQMQAQRREMADLLGLPVTALHPPRKVKGMRPQSWRPPAAPPKRDEAGLTLDTPLAWA